MPETAHLHSNVDDHPKISTLLDSRIRIFKQEIKSHIHLYPWVNVMSEMDDISPLTIGT